jgi:hypothetical protein
MALCKFVSTKRHDNDGTATGRMTMAKAYVMVEIRNTMDGGLDDVEIIPTRALPRTLLVTLTDGPDDTEDKTYTLDVVDDELVVRRMA